jgi:ATP-dependent protease ClpP protease subunit
MAKKFFNLIPKEDVAHIYIYGDIGDDDGKVEDIVSELLAVQGHYRSIIVHINSHGGEVYGGIAIVNAFKSSTADIVIHIDGIASSMASVIALCGKPLYMSKYARLMLHNVKVGVFGSKDDLRVTIAELDTLETTLCEIIAQRMGKTTEEIKGLYFDGKDHWFTAEEALSLKLIDGIYDAGAIPENSTPEQIYKIFNNRLETQTQNVNTMDITEFKKRKSFVNAANDEDILRVIDELEERVVTFERQEQEREEAEVNSLLDAAVADERIKTPQRAQFYALLKADRTNGEAILKSLTPKKRVMNMLGNHEGNAQTSAWEARMEAIREKQKNNF